MLVKAAEKYYFDMDYNCAESVLMAANDAYGLGLEKDAGLGLSLVEERAHATDGFRERCAAFAAAFEAELGSQLCSAVKPVHADPTGTRRCFAPVEAACRLLGKELGAPHA